MSAPSNRTDFGRVYCPLSSEYSKWDWILARQSEISRPLRETPVPSGIVEPFRRVNGIRSGGVCDSEFRFVGGLSRTDDPKRDMLGIRNAYRVDSNELEYIDEDVIFGGVFSGHFGHFILDSIARLWYLVSNSEDRRRIAIVSLGKPRQYWLEFLQLLNIEPERIIWVNNHPIQFRSVLVPEEATHSWGQKENFHRSILDVYGTIASNAINVSNQETCPKKVYLTRTALGPRKREVVGERYFEAFFRDHGYTIVSPERLSIAEQVRLIASADEIVSTMGTLAHLAIFAKPGTRVTHLITGGRQPLHPQGWIDTVKSLDWLIVDVSQSFLFATRSLGPVLAGPTESFARYAKDYFGADISISSSEDTLYYLRVWLDYYENNYRKIETLTSLDILDYMSLIVRDSPFQPEDSGK